MPGEGPPAAPIGLAGTSGEPGVRGDVPWQPAPGIPDARAPACVPGATKHKSIARRVERTSHMLHRVIDAQASRGYRFSCDRISGRGRRPPAAPPASRRGAKTRCLGGGGSERSNGTDLALTEGTIRCRIIDFFGLPSSDSALFQYFVPKKLPEVAL